MKKLVFILLSMMLCIGCSYNRYHKNSTTRDSLVKVFTESGEDFIIIPLDSFLQVKDSFVFCKEEHLWMTKRLYWFNYICPDTIIVALTRNGKLDDSVEAVRQGLIKDNTGHYYSPAYVFSSTVGDTWIYDINGKFIEFNKSPFPHSGKSQIYEP